MFYICSTLPLPISNQVKSDVQQLKINLQRNNKRKAHQQLKLLSLYSPKNDRVIDQRKCVCKSIARCPYVTVLWYPSSPRRGEKVAQGPNTLTAT